MLVMPRVGCYRMSMLYLVHKAWDFHKLPMYLMSRNAYWRMLLTRKVAMNVLAHPYRRCYSRCRYLRAVEMMFCPPEPANAIG